MTRAIRILFVLVLFKASCAVGGLIIELPQAVHVSLGQCNIQLDNGLAAISIPNGFTSAEIGEPDLPWLNVFLDGETFHSSDYLELHILQADTLELAVLPKPAQSPIKTDEGGPVGASITADEIQYSEVVYPTITHRLSRPANWHGRILQWLSWTPFRYYPETNQLIIIREAEFRKVMFSHGGQADLHSGLPNVLEHFDDIREFAGSDSPLRSLSRTTGIEEAQTIVFGLPTDVQYVIITSDELAPSLRPLAEWRQKQGYRVGIALVSQIEAVYPGEDLPAKIRAYLTEAYDGGLEFCALGGDETIVPIRYAYHAYADEMPDIGQLQICDLYYGDLTGNWDVDGDGIYGEYLQDSADVFPEIYVGRLLAGNPAQAEIVVGKILTYETNPGNGDPSYLNRSLFTCADHMRDWDGALGQHAIIAERFPTYYTMDLVNHSENPNGSQPDPEMPEGEEFVTDLSAGWGWATLINHGRADGFILRAANLNEWPKSYVWSTGNNGDGHGHLNLLGDNPTPGIVVSVSCAMGGFDMDGPLFDWFWGPTICEKFLQMPEGGAAALIAYSRWGWVASSYKIVDKFYEYTFDPALAPQIGVAFALAKANYPYYRDQNFGLNLYGDPAMKPWTDLPQHINADFPDQVPVNSGPVTFSVLHEGTPIADAMVTAAYADTVFFTGATGENGEVEWTSGPDRLGGYDITVSKSGYLPSQAKLIVPIVTDILDEEDAEGAFPFVLEQNHPNPFNPSTTIEFSVSTTQAVRLEVYNILGQRVNTLVDDILPAGQHSIEFDGDGEDGLPLASGMYFYRLRAGTKTETKKMVLMK